MKVSWVDSQCWHGWKDLNEFKIIGDKDVDCVSVGYLFKETDKIIILAPHLSSMLDDVPQGQGIMAIPRIAITKIEDLEKPGTQEDAKDGGCLTPSWGL